MAEWQDFRRDGEEDRRKYAELIKLHAYNSNFITRDQEMKILEDGVSRFRITLDESRGILLSVTDANDISSRTRCSGPRGRCCRPRPIPRSA